MTNQIHLNHKEKINLGAFYTPKNYIYIAWNKIKKFLDNNSIVLDSSCGYGNFFDIDINLDLNFQLIANDIDKIAYKTTKNNFQNINIFNKNALKDVSRAMFNIENNKKLIIIGNPPYNDTTSIIRNNIKENNINIDNDIKTRDYGMSFLLSYTKLEADIICVLHPLSYLIKKANYNLLKNFTKKYKLIDSTIIDSKTFKETSKGISFPIIIALYQKDNIGMDYNYIQNFEFKTINNKIFKLNQFDYISNYIRKYPIKNKLPQKDDILFWTMRDINALKRNRTFVQNFGYNTIIIDKSKLDYYIYVDVFKQFNKIIPYYFGNLDVIIDSTLFIKYKKYFIQEALSRQSDLKKYYKLDDIDIQLVRQKIVEYFKIILGEHYMYIEKMDKKQKELLVAIPLTTTSGKTRVKQRDNIYGYGLPFASRTNKFNQKNYIEWQIGYDIEVGKEFSEKLNRDLTTIKDIKFTAYNKKKKYLYELSEYLYYMVDFGLISIDKLNELKDFLNNLDDSNLIEKHSHCQIKRTHPQNEKINNLDFEILKVEYPQLIHKFKNYEIIAEITIREKQRAVGVQPMLYFCFPITELISDELLIGRTAKVKEFAYFKFDKNNAEVILEIMRIFGMLSISHRFDILKIIDLIIINQRS